LVSTGTRPPLALLQVLFAIGENMAMRALWREQMDQTLREEAPATFPIGKPLAR